MREYFIAKRDCLKQLTYNSHRPIKVIQHLGIDCSLITSHLPKKPHNFSKTSMK